MSFNDRLVGVNNSLGHGAHDDAFRTAARRWSRQGVHEHARQRTRGPQRVRQTAAGDDLVRRGRSRQPVAGHRAPSAAHACPARLCRSGRPRVYVDPARSRVRLCLSLGQGLDRPRAAYDEGTERAAWRILLWFDLAGHRDRLCRARASAPHHVNRPGGWQPVAGVSHIARPRPARLSRRRGNLAPPAVGNHRSLYALYDH
jgi:hypothetical protein